MRKLVTYVNGVGYREVKPEQAYRPADPALAMGRLLALLRERGIIDHDSATDICKNFDVEEEIE